MPHQYRDTFYNSFSYIYIFVLVWHQFSPILILLFKHSNSRKGGLKGYKNFYEKTRLIFLFLVSMSLPTALIFRIFLMGKLFRREFYTYFIYSTTIGSSFNIHHFMILINNNNYCGFFYFSFRFDDVWVEWFQKLRDPWSNNLGVPRGLCSKIGHSIRSYFFYKFTNFYFYCWMC